MQILVTCDYTLCPDALDPLKALGQVIHIYPIDRKQLREQIVNVDAWLCFTSVKVDREVLAAARRLRVVATPSTGTDHIDKQALAARNIILLDIATEYELLEQFTATAEGAWTLLLACTRRLPMNFERAKQGCVGVADSGHLPRQLSGKTLGVIGYGRLGRMMGQVGKAFRMRVLACDIKAVDDDGVRQVDLDTLLAESDFVSLHVHLSDQTQCMIDRRCFSLMKRGAVLVNTARGDLLDEAALLDALESGQVGAAGLDVVHDEWDPQLAQHPVIEYASNHDNLIITPHVASACIESIAGARIFIAQKLATHLETI